MRRVVSIWLASLQADLRRRSGNIAPAPEASLRALATWCLRYAPLVALDPPDGLWIDISGCAHLFGNESALLADLLARLAAAGLTARAAIAETPGAAHALARFSTTREAIAPAGSLATILAPLPPAALRLPEEAAALAARLGITSVAALAALPRGPLARRFGAATLHRLDQALGRAPEPISPLPPPAALAAHLAFPEPLLSAEALSAAIGRLASALSAMLERKGLGARQLDLFCERIDRAVIAVRIGTVRPSRNAPHLAKLLLQHLEEVDPGPGVEAMRLHARLAEPIATGATVTAFSGAAFPGAVFSGEAGNPDLSMLLDRLANRFGPACLYRVQPLESDVPERAVRHLPPLAPSRGKTWPLRLPRPSRLLSPPEPVSALALLPDSPPARFVWRGERHRLTAGDGPERIFGEWWKRDSETLAVRDYFRVEDEQGRRFWLYRRGDGADPKTGDGGWFLHGFF
ncbi:MAG: DUF6504 family protein [Acetobacteraceae bacterium]